VAYLPSIVSSWEGGLLSGVDLIYFTSPTVNAAYSSFGTNSSGCLAVASLK